MANIRKIEDEPLLEKLMQVFKQHGFVGASLNLISEATGLKKPSLYHRFPNGKEQMAEEVLSFAEKWIEANMIAPQSEERSPAEKIAHFVKQIDALYNSGKESCVLNMLAPAEPQENALGEHIRRMMRILLKTLAAIAEESGFDPKAAELRAEQALVEIQGSLIVSRGLGSAKPFKRMQKRLPEILIGQAVRVMSK